MRRCQALSNGVVKVERQLALALVAILALPPVKFVVFQSIPNLHLYNFQANIVVSVILAFLILPTVSTVAKRVGRIVLPVICLFSFFFAVNILVFPNNVQNILNHMLRIYFVSFLCFSLALSIRDHKLVFRYLHKISYAIISCGVAMLAATVVIGAVGAAPTGYNMSLSYYLLIPTLALISVFYQHKRIIDLVFIALALTVIVAMGSRGPLLSIAFFILFYNLKLRVYTYKVVLVDLGTVLGLGLMIFHYSRIAEWMLVSLQRLGIHSRTLGLLLAGSFAWPSNRDLIAQELIDVVLKNPLLGIGLLGDLRSHNIILETYLFFGIFSGSILLFALLSLIALSLMYSGDKELSLLIGMFASYAIPDALLNLTIWGKDIFWIYLGFTIVAIMKRRKILQPTMIATSIG